MWAKKYLCLSASAPMTESSATVGPAVYCETQGEAQKESAPTVPDKTRQSPKHASGPAVQGWGTPRFLTARYLLCCIAQPLFLSSFDINDITASPTACRERLRSSLIMKRCAFFGVCFPSLPLLASGSSSEHPDKTSQENYTEIEHE